MKSLILGLYIAAVAAVMLVSLSTRGRVFAAFEIIYTSALVCVPIVLVSPPENTVDWVVIAFSIAAVVSLVVWRAWGKRSGAPAWDFVWIIGSVVVYAVLVTIERVTPGDQIEGAVVGFAAIACVCIFASYSIHVMRRNMRGMKGPALGIAFYAVLFGAFLSLSLLQSQKSYVLIGAEMVFLIVCAFFIVVSVGYLAVGVYDRKRNAKIAEDEV